MWAMIDTNTNEVKNIIVWDGESEFVYPSDIILINIIDKEVGIGWIYDTSTQEFISPVVEVPTETVSNSTPGEPQIL